MSKKAALSVVVLLLTLMGLFVGDSHHRVTHAQTNATVRINPASQSVTSGDQATISVDVANVQNLGSFDITLTFNPSLLQIPAGGVVVDTAFLASTGKTATALSPIVDNTAGTVSFGAYSLGSAAGPSGSGRLATIIFNTNSAGTTNLELTYAFLTYPDGTENPSAPVDGTLTVTSVVTPSPTPGTSPAPTTTPVPTATAQPTATPTATPPDTTRVVLQLRLQGVINMPSSGQDDRFIRVAVKQGETTVTTQNIRMRRTQSDINGTTVVYYTNAVSDPDKLANLSAGLYDFYISGPAHLTRKYSAEVVDTPVNTLNFIATRLLAGDIMDNNEVDDTDYNRLVENFGCAAGRNPPPGKNCPSAGAPIPGDIDFDGEVSVFDFTYLIGNFSLRGD